MSMSDALAAELERESASTRRLLERVPEDRFSWKPHEKSMTLGQLAYHIAALPKAISDLLAGPSAELGEVPLPEPGSGDELLAVHDRSVAAALERFRSWDDADLRESWSMSVGGRRVAELPRIGGVRAVLLNHVYHHRGQLTVYLRLLDVPLPATYGSSADEGGSG